MKNCCVRGPGSTYFALVGVSSLSIFLLPIVSHIIEPSGKYLHFPNTSNSTATGTGAVAASYSTSSRSIGSAGYSTYSHYVGNTFSYSHNYNHDTDRGRHEYGHSAFNHHEYHSSILPSIFSLENNILGGTQTVDSMNYHVQPSPHSSWALFLAVTVALVFYRVLATSAFTTLGIIVNDSVDKDVRGA